MMLRVALIALSVLVIGDPFPARAVVPFTGRPEHTPPISGWCPNRRPGAGRWGTVALTALVRKRVGPTH